MTKPHNYVEPLENTGTLHNPLSTETPWKVSKHLT